MGGLAMERFGRFHARLAQGRMRVNRRGDVFGYCAHFDRQHAFGDQFSRAHAADPHTEDAARFRIQHQFRQPVVASQRRGAA